MRIVLKPGEKVDVGFEDSDGEITISFNATSIKVETEWPDSTERVGVLYEENFGSSDLEEVEI